MFIYCDIKISYWFQIFISVTFSYFFEIASFR